MDMLANLVSALRIKELDCVLVVLALFSIATGTTRADVVVTNLVTDDQTAHAATLTDPDLKNAWGISSSATSPFWVSDNATGKATVYSVNPATNIPAKVALTVTIPGEGSVTGQVFNAVGASAFNGDNFLFVSEDGTVSGWRNALGTTAETLALASDANNYKGAAYASVGSNAYLYAANFRSGAIDVFKGAAAAPDLAGSFTDPNVPSGFAPFNIQNLGGTLYVTYAVQDVAKDDDVPGAGNGIVDAFDTNGNFLHRVASQGVLNSPWGLAIAPPGFEGIGGDLLVGNFGDGKINAFNPITLANDGPVKGPGGVPLTIGGLWGLSVGNGGNGGSTQLVYFSAGPNDETHGLFGSLSSVPEPSSLVLSAAGCGAIAGWAAIRRRRK